MKFDPLPWPGHLTVARATRVPSHVAILGNFPPRRCGLATYTEDSWLALKAHGAASQVDVYAMDDGQVEGYGPEITRLIPQDDVAAYHAAADAIDASGAQILWVQHEFGIFGGEAGSYLLGLVNRVKIPVALTLHTILESPNGAQRTVLEALLERAATVIVMAEKGREILERVYAVDPDKVSVIPHGIPDRPMGDPATARARLNLPDRPTILTFGLLSPDKGIADMIEAMPTVQAQCPDAHYIVLGATHPHLVRHEGEAYREMLAARVAELGLENPVSFVDQFFALDDLTEWLTAADVYVTPYRNPAQITSGTLSYAVGLGKAVVSTPYVHATEILADDHGLLVPFRSPNALAVAVGGLLTDNARRVEISARAYARGRTMIWPRNAEAVLAAQLDGSLPDAAEGLIIAYEPVWAIGTGIIPTLADVAAAHSFIRARLAARYGGGGHGVRILYGGSVTPANAGELLAVDEVGGVLVGGASLTAASLLAIAGAAA
jgi:glycosyltransferase involved in cell wall biosynthesis